MSKLNRKIHTGTYVTWGMFESAFLNTFSIYKRMIPTFPSYLQPSGRATAQDLLS
jgi:hypothetical protein